MMRLNPLALALAFGAAADTGADTEQGAHAEHGAVPVAPPETAKRPITILTSRRTFMHPRIGLIASIVVTLCGASAIGAPTALPNGGTIAVTHLAQYDVLLQLATSTDAAAKRADWRAARRYAANLDMSWKSVRPTAVQGWKTKSYAESLDASLKWLANGLDRKNARDVRNAVARITTALHELRERV